MGWQLITSVGGHEGLRLKAYQDSLGIWTIGYGRNLQTLEIDQKTASLWLTEDLKKAEGIAGKLPYWNNLNAARKDAMIELVYNLEHRLDKFVRFHAAMQQEDYATASKELLDSLWAKQVGPTRSGHLAKQIRLGEYWNG